MPVTFAGTFHRGLIITEYPPVVWKFQKVFAPFSTNTVPNGWDLVPVTAIPARPVNGSTHNFDVTPGDVSSPCATPGAIQFSWFHIDPGDPGFFGTFLGDVPEVGGIASAVRDDDYGATLDILAAPVALIDHVTVDWADGSTPEDVTLSGLGTATLAHTFAGPGTSTGITLTITPTADYPNCGIGSPNIPPRAFFTVATEELRADFDAILTDDIDGTVALYEWTYGAPGIEGGAPPVAPSYLYNAEGNYNVQLVVTDNLGATDAYATFVALSTGAPFAADVHGRMFALSPDGTALRIYEAIGFPATFHDTAGMDFGSSSRPVALWLEAREGNFRKWLIVRQGDAITNVLLSYSVFYTDDDGQTWPGSTVLLDDTYVAPAGCAFEGGQVVIAAKSGTDPVEIHAWRIFGATGGGTWEMIGDGFTLPAGSTKKQCGIEQLSTAGSARLVALHFESGTRWTSDDFGENWTEVI